MRKVTQDQKEIRQWAVRHNVHPVERAPFIQDSDPARLDLVYGKLAVGNEHLQPISWEHFFAMFRLMDLVLVYDDDHNFELLKRPGEDSAWFEGKPLVA